MTRTLFLVFIFFFTVPLFAAESYGKATYDNHCASCHEAGNSQIPSFFHLHELTPNLIRNALTGGSMRQIGKTLTISEQTAVAEYITGKKITAENSESVKLKYCESNPALQQDFLRQPRWSGWGVDLENTRFQKATDAGLTSNDIPRLKLKWVFAYPGEVLALGQTNVIGGRLFVPSHSGNVYSLDALTGCAYWRFKADSSVRTAINAGVSSPDLKDGYLIYFTDTTANTYAVNAQNHDDSPVHRPVKT